MVLGWGQQMWWSNAVNEGPLGLLAPDQHHLLLSASVSMPTMQTPAAHAHAAIPSSQFSMNNVELCQSWQTCRETR